MSAARAPRPPIETQRDLGILHRLVPFLRAHIGLIILSALFLPLLTGTQLLQPYLLRLAIDRHITPAAAGEADALVGFGRLLTFFAILLAVELALRFGQIYLMQLAGQRIMHDLRSTVFAHIQSLSMEFFDRNPVGRTMTRVTSDIETLNDLVSQGIVAMARDVVTLVAIIGVMLWIDWRLTLASLVVVPVLVGILAILRSRLRAVYNRTRTLVARQNAFLQETFSGIEVVQAFVQEDRNRKDFGVVRGDILKTELRAVRLSSLLSASVQAATTVSTALVLVYGGFGIIGGTVTVGILVQFLEYLRRFYTPLEDLSDKYDTLQRAAAACTKIFGLMDVEQAVKDPESPLPLPRFDDVIRFDKVAFSYGSDGARGPSSGKAMIFENLSLSIRQGEKVALVGATGAGKSTIIKLLLRYYDVEDGEITVDGVDLRDMSQRPLRRSYGTVPQDVFLFTDTIAANIGLNSSEISRERIEEAARRVEADSFIRDLPGGYDARLGERGANLSFGERQLLAFARALAFDPPVLVLDEATSSVDSETEARIQRALSRLIADRTSIIVAHRLSTIRDVDRIIVLHHGEVREEGTHEGLLAQNGIYARLYRLQHAQAMAAD
jgi:ATP-binding cassette subfamily B protein